MLIDAGLPLNLWAEAILTANYIRNRSPSAGENKTPHEHFGGSKPDISHMRVFGSAAYVHVPKQLRQKLDPVCRKGIFVGYEPARNHIAYYWTTRRSLSAAMSLLTKQHHQRAQTRESWPWQSQKTAATAVMMKPMPQTA